MKGRKMESKQGIGIHQKCPQQGNFHQWKSGVWESGERHLQLEIPGLATAIYKCPGGHCPSMLVCVVGETFYLSFGYFLQQTLIDSLTP